MQLNFIRSVASLQFSQFHLVEPHLSESSSMKEAHLALPSDRFSFNYVERLPHLLDDSIGVFACFTGQSPRIEAPG